MRDILSAAEAEALTVFKQVLDPEESGRLYRYASQGSFRVRVISREILPFWFCVFDDFQVGVSGVLE